MGELHGQFIDADSIVRIGMKQFLENRRQRFIYGEEARIAGPFWMQAIVIGGTRPGQAGDTRACDGRCVRTTTRGTGMDAYPAAVEVLAVFFGRSGARCAGRRRAARLRALFTQSDAMSLSTGTTGLPSTT